jgi:hypothetical protein
MGYFDDFDNEFLNKEKILIIEKIDMTFYL